jgi:hypothetical protein
MPDGLPSPSFREQLRSLTSPGALTAGAVGAAVAAIVGKLTAHLFVAVAIFLFAAAASLAYSRLKTSRGERLRLRALSLGVVIFGLLGAGTLTYGIARELSKGMRAEEKLVSSLAAGQDFARFAAALGPAEVKRPIGKYVVYQFERPDETLQAVTARDGEVLSYAIYAKSADFHPVLEHGATVKLNETNVDRPFGGESSGEAAIAYCGAHKAGYFESFGGDNAVDDRYYVLGVSDANGRQISPLTLPVCRALLQGGLEEKCHGPDYEKLDPALLRCIQSSPPGRRLLLTLRATVYIETAPGVALTPTMLIPPDAVPFIRESGADLQGLY